MMMMMAAHTHSLSINIDLSYHLTALLMQSHTAKIRKKNMM